MLAYDLNEDFKEIKTIFIEEKLEEEELKEGLVEETYEVKVALTSHAVNRMYHTEKREVEWEEMEELLLITGEELLGLRNGEEFTILSSDSTISVIGNAHFQDAKLILVIHTVIAVETTNGKRRKVVVKGNNKRIIATT
jgi:hypothetical protein